MGELYFLKNNNDLSIVEKRIDDQELEIKNFKLALGKAEEHILVLKDKMSKQLQENELAIYDAHISIVQDPELIENTINFIRSENISADLALYKSAKEFIKLLNEVDDDYIRSRIKDIEEVTSDIIRILQGKSNSLSLITKPVILATEKITTNQLSEIDRNMLLGLITADGGATDHTAIISKAMGIPAIAGVKDEIFHFSNGTNVIIDADTGYIYVDPDEHTTSSFRSRAEKASVLKALNFANANLPAKTRSGKTIKIYANVGHVQDVKAAASNGAEGIGLLRSELCFLDRNKLPTEQDHYNIYKEMLDALPGKEVVLRLLDIGSDKRVAYIDMPKEENPAMGLRALRLGFNQYEKLLKPQIRAILRLTENYDIKILCPMIAIPEDLKQIKDAINKEKLDLSAEGIKINEETKVGIMVEVPNVALMPELFVNEADFFSFGTNDLAQYMMAADRTNGTVSNYIDKAVPGILKMIENFIIEAHQKEKWVGICGELASNKALIEKFINMGIDELSMSPSLIPKIKSFIRELH
jgi:phosphotransferase system enzyme I (PtsI)